MFIKSGRNDRNMDMRAYSIRERDFMKKVFYLAIVFMIEIFLFGLELISIGPYIGAAKIATEMSATLICGSLYLFSALIFRRAAQFKLYPLIYSYTISLAFLYSPNPKKGYLATKLIQVCITSFRAIWVVVFYKSFRNIFDWENFLKYKSDEWLIGKCIF